MELISKIILPICLLIIMAERISYRRKRKELLRKLFPAEITAELAELQIRYVKKYRTKLKGRLMDKGIYRYEMPKGFIKNYYKEIIEPSLSLTGEEKEKWQIVMKSKCLMPEKKGIPFVKILKGFLICFALYNVFMMWYYLPIRHYNEDGSYDEVTGIFRPVRIESYLEDGTEVLTRRYDYNGLKLKEERVTCQLGDRPAGYTIEDGKVTYIYDDNTYLGSRKIEAKFNYSSSNSYTIEWWDEKEYLGRIEVKRGKVISIELESDILSYSYDELMNGCKISWDDWGKDKGSFTLRLSDGTFTLMQREADTTVYYRLGNNLDNQYLNVSLWENDGTGSSGEKYSLFYYEQ